MKSKRGGGCGSVLFILAIVIALFTKPSELRMRTKVASEIGFFRTLASNISVATGMVEYKYDDYYVFSTLSARLPGTTVEKTFAIGIFGTVILMEN